jgi:hypothetical protein
MKQAILQSKWRWWIPLVSLFFIEEQVEWADDAPTEEQGYYRTILSTLFFAYHIAFAIVLFVKYVL